MTTLSPQQKETLRIAEYKARDTVRSHIDAARRLYDNGFWPQSCFLAMTAIEEIGKSLAFQLASAREDASVLRELRDHLTKALFGAVTTLILNDGARARHGRHPVTGIDRVEAIRLLGEAPGEWMSLRNGCLYVDLNPDAHAVTAPCERITREHAYLMIVVALEAYAEIHAPGFTYHHVSVDQLPDGARQQKVVAEIEDFRAREAGHMDVDRLDFLANPDRIALLKAAVRQVRSSPT